MRFRLRFESLETRDNPSGPELLDPTPPVTGPNPQSPPAQSPPADAPPPQSSSDAPAPAPPPDSSQLRGV